VSRRRSRRRQPLTPWRIARIGAAAAAALFIAWWAFKLIAVEEMARANPFAAAMVAPKDPRVAMRLALVETLISPAKADPRHREAAIAALDRSALAEEPFLLEASRAQAAGNAARAERLLVEARRRNPRERLVRLMLLQRYLGTERWPEAGAEISVITRLVPRAQDLLAPALSKLAAQPQYAAPMAELLARSPGLKGAVLQQLAASGVPAGQILRLAGPATRRAGPWQQTLLVSLIGAGDIRGAYSVWLRVSGISGGQWKGVYDPGFAGLGGPPPFNWSYSGGEGGNAERSRGGLQVDYFGRVDTQLVKQVLLLAPGRYRFDFRAQGNASGDGGRIQWSITCAKGGAELLRLPLAGVTSLRGFSAAFTVPAGCDGQWLTLSGSAGDVAGQQSALISGLRISGGA